MGEGKVEEVGWVASYWCDFVCFGFFWCMCGSGGGKEVRNGGMACGSTMIIHDV